MSYRSRRFSLSYSVLVVGVLVAAIVAMVVCGRAQADFGPIPGQASVAPLNSDGTVDTQAGSHPFSFNVHFALKLDENGESIPKGSGKAGNIVARAPWPGIFQTIWGQPERFVSTYFAKYNKDPDSKDWHDWPYFAGDGAVQAEDG